MLIDIILTSLAILSAGIFWYLHHRLGNKYIKLEIRGNVRRTYEGDEILSFSLVEKYAFPWQINFSPILINILVGNPFSPLYIYNSMLSTGIYLLWNQLIEFKSWRKRVYKFFTTGFVLTPSTLTVSSAYVRNLSYSVLADSSELNGYSTNLQFPDKINLQSITVHEMSAEVPQNVQRNVLRKMVNSELIIEVTNIDRKDQKKRGPVKKNRNESDVLFSLFSSFDIPTEVYVNNSMNFEITMYKSERTLSSGRPVAIEEKGDDKPSDLLRIPAHAFLEFELREKGFEFDGEKCQICSVDDSTLNYLWNCHFPISGSHEYAIIVRLVKGNKKTVLKQITRSVKVVQIWHLTQRQVWILATMAGSISGIVGFIEILHQIGVW